MNGHISQKERLVELRAEGLSFSEIAAELGVSKQTLINWSKELAVELANAQAIRLAGFFEVLRLTKEKRIESLAQRLKFMYEELDRRDLSEVKTETLLTLTLKYTEYLRSEYEPLVLTERSGLDAQIDDTLTVETSWSA